MKKEIEYILYAEHEDSELEFHGERVNELIDLFKQWSLEMVGEDVQLEDHNHGENFSNGWNTSKQEIRDRIKDSQ